MNNKRLTEIRERLNAPNKLDAAVHYDRDVKYLLNLIKQILKESETAQGNPYKVNQTLNLVPLPRYT